MAKRRKAIKAGRLVRVGLWSCPYPADGQQARAAKSKCCTMARQKLNDKKSAQKLEFIIASNFEFGDLHVVLTFSDDVLPDCRDDALDFIKKFIRALRKSRKARELELKYIYVLEGNHGDKRWHFHIILNRVGNDLQELQTIWPYGEVHIEHIDERGYEGLAQYLTKEPREHGGRNGLPAWVASRGLKKPEVESGWVPDDVTVTAPPGAIILEMQPPYRNEFGEFAYIKYLLPRVEVAQRKGRPPRKKPPKYAKIE